jgi:hypothetical protein
LAGGHGVRLGLSNVVMVALKNDFAVASHRGIAHDAPAGVLERAVIAKNLLGPTNGFHLKLIPPDGAQWFLPRNQYRARATTNDFAPFLNPVSVPVHHYR